MNINEIDNKASQLLLWKWFQSEQITDDIKQRILNIDFDCTPNRWIIWADRQIKKENWYFLDESVKKHAFNRFKLLNFKNLGKVILKAIKDVIGENVILEWYSIYWSFLYSTQTPNDLDILILISWKEWLTYDALKYRIWNEPIFQNHFKMNNNELWLTIVSLDQLNQNNKNYIVTDAALVDKWTSFTIGKWINSEEIPDFILNQNALKLINWGISSLYNNQETFIKRIYEALLMREYMIKRWNNHYLHNINRHDFLDNIQSKSSYDLLKISFQLIDLLKNDETKIRENIILNLN